MRNPKRTAATAAALMIGVALVGFIATFAASTKASINGAVDTDFHGDFVLDSGSFGADRWPQPRRWPATSPAGPSSPRSRPTAARPCELDGEEHVPRQLGRGDDAGSMFDIDVAAGRLDATSVPTASPSHEDYATEHDLAIGRTVTVAFRRAHVTLTVEGDLRRRRLDRRRVRRPRRARRARRRSARRGDLRPAAPTASTRRRPRRSSNELTRTTRRPTCSTARASRRARAASIDLILNLIYALLALAIVIALMGITNTLALSIFERTRELGVLRAVGMTRGQLKATVRWEAMIIALFGTLLGLGIGAVLRMEHRQRTGRRGHRHAGDPGPDAGDRHHDRRPGRRRRRRAAGSPGRQARRAGGDRQPSRP